MRSLTVPLTAAVLLLGLTGCAPGNGGNPLNPAGEPVAPGATYRPDRRPARHGRRTAPMAEPLELDGQGLEFHVTGALRGGSLRGQDLDVDLELAHSC